MNCSSTFLSRNILPITWSSPSPVWWVWNWSKWNCNRPFLWTFPIKKKKYLGKKLHLLLKKNQINEGWNFSSDCNCYCSGLRKKSIFCERDKKVWKIKTYIFCYKGEKRSCIRMQFSFSFSGKPGYKQCNNLKHPLLWLPAQLSLDLCPPDTEPDVDPSPGTSLTEQTLRGWAVGLWGWSHPNSLSFPGWDPNFLIVMNKTLIKK